jgi:hypothetical protein
MAASQGVGFWALRHKIAIALIGGIVEGHGKGRGGNRKTVTSDA